MAACHLADSAELLFAFKAIDSLTFIFVDLRGIVAPGAVSSRARIHFYGALQRLLLPALGNFLSRGSQILSELANWAFLDSVVIAVEEVTLICTLWVGALNWEVSSVHQLVNVRHVAL